MKCDWSNGIDLEELDRVKTCLLNGGVVIFPTETVYGIAASALSDEGIEKVYRVKKRPRDKAVNIMVSDTDDISKYAYVSSNEMKVIENFMPGEITIILDKKEDFGTSFTKEDTVGVRIPNNEIALEILKEVKVPLIVSSANISNYPSVTDPNNLEVFEKDVDIIIDGGIISGGVPSTIVRIDGDIVSILREGKITKEQIEEIIE